MINNKAILRSAFFFFVAMATALFLGDQLIYKLLVVPKLGNWDHVPIVWWLAIFSPVILVFVIAGSKVRSVFELFIFSIIGGLSSTIFGYFVAATNQPGHKKSLALENPFEYWTIDLLESVGIVLVLLGTSRLLTGLYRKAFRRKASKSTDR